MPRLRWLILTITLSVTSPVRADTPSFQRDVMPVLTRAGCNSGACHGSFQGRGEFRLSLLGFDAAADHDALVREARGRRILPGAIEHSLLLRKPSGGMAHGGGVKLPLSSDGYKVVHAWIKAGMPGPRPDDPRIVKLE